MAVLEKAVHELKESVVAPFFTVEAIGLLFGFDMIGKTLAPKTYHSWRNIYMLNNLVLIYYWIS